MIHACLKYYYTYSGLFKKTASNVMYFRRTFETNVVVSSPMLLAFYSSRNMLGFVKPVRYPNRKVKTAQYFGVKFVKVGEKLLL